MRLVATDLDGTLVRSDYTIGSRTVDVLGRVIASGVPLVLVTGRPIRWLHSVYDQLGVQPLAVCANGAAVYDPATDSIVHSTPLTAQALTEACSRLRERVPGVVFAVERDGGRAMLHEKGYRVGPWEADHGSVRETSSEDLVSAPAAKLLVRAGVRHADAFTALVGTCLDGIAEATNSSSSGVVEVSAAGVTKASGLAWVAGHFGVASDEVIAFGDMPNDLPMLGWVGRGVAMANGHPAVRAAAHDVTPHSNEEDGVAAYLEKLFAL